jgi:hypothetical protein
MPLTQSYSVYSNAATTGYVAEWGWGYPLKAWN